VPKNGGRLSRNQEPIGGTIVGHEEVPRDPTTKSDAGGTPASQHVQDYHPHYLRAVEEFAQYFRTPPDRLGLDHVQQYQAHLFTDRKLEPVSVAQQLSALRFFFLKTLKRPWMVEDMPVPKQPIRLPDILSQEEVERLIQSADSPLHRVCILVLYANGGAPRRISPAEN
jgi:site-specific recombinase XerD